MDNREKIVSVRDLKLWFENDFGAVQILNGINFDIYKGETLGIVGESGCGKSTMIRTILRIIEPTEGSIEFDGQDITRMSKRQIAQIRKNMQIVFQDPYSSLDPRWKVGAIIEEPMLINKIEMTKEERQARVEKLMKLVGLDASYVDRYPHEFSGGQRQRVAIARALATNPKLLMLDEAVSALDVSVRAQILNLLEDLQKELKLTYVFVSHDLSVIEHICDRVVIMYLGKIVEIGTKDEIFNNIDCAKLELQQSLENREKRINIAVATSELWMPLLAAFALEYPDIMVSQVALKIGQLHNVNLSRLHTFIFAERNEFYASDVGSVCLFQEHPVAMIPVNHPLAKRDVIELKELENEILFLPYADHSLNKRIRELFYINQVPLKHVNEGIGSVCRSMVSQGRGITITSSHPFRVNVPSTCYVPIHAPECHWEQHLFWNKDHVFSAEELQFRDFVLDMYCG